jgi:hypothetical protein
MQWADILARLNDLPDTYLRSGATFNWWQNAQVAGLYKDANAVDGTLSQADFVNAVFSWVDMWGQLNNILRFNNETDAEYITRIQFLATVPGGAPASISEFLSEVESFQAAVSEDFATCSWSLSFQSNVTPTQYDQVASDLAYVRPAGVPFKFSALSGGLFLGTLNYLKAPRVTGAFLLSPTTSVIPNIPQSTNNALPTLPTVYLTDPILNPSLA